MTILLLTCVFGITPDFPGVEKKATIRIPYLRYEFLLEEEGNSAKRKLCREVFHERADLVWIEESGTLEQPAQPFQPFTAARFLAEE
jgi:hypothetical protein